MPPALAMNCALPPLLLSLNSVSPPLFVVMVALAAVLLLLNDTMPPLLFMMTAFPAELALLKFKLSLLVKLGANAEMLPMPAPLMSKVIPVPLVMKLKAGAPAVIVLIKASSEIVTDVGAPLLVNVAVLSGTVAKLQLLSWVHSLGTGAPPPVQMPSTACATGARVASAASETHARRATRGSVPPLGRAEDNLPDRQCCRVPATLAPPSRSPSALNESNAEHLIVAHALRTMLPSLPIWIVICMSPTGGPRPSLSSSAYWPYSFACIPT